MRRTEARPGPWSRTDGTELLWLYENGVGDFCGFDLDPGSAGLWIIHAMYERTCSEKEAPRKPSPGWDTDPGSGWRRLRWRELADRAGDRIVRLDHDRIYPIPSRHCFPSVDLAGSNPPIQAPAEGHLDQHSFHALAEALRRFAGPETVVFAHWTEAVIHEPDVVFKGRLADLEALESLPVVSSPSNLWPADESWLIYTDWDLWGTKIYGPPELRSLIEADEFLETSMLPAYHHMLNPRQ
ncbi:hypothetical protein [Glycomyces dulcitolivorans]|uniref:hypothetical protein n=1 Tax=Glycomyces dulcitolivorans TaxID=2200759 RepID=UPI00130097D1|nr:hypothetical protein [Glycomyces dulcitolivorans]